VRVHQGKSSTGPSPNRPRAQPRRGSGAADEMMADEKERAEHVMLWTWAATTWAG